MDRRAGHNPPSEAGVEVGYDDRESNVIPCATACGQRATRSSRSAGFAWREPSFSLTLPIETISAFR